MGWIDIDNKQRFLVWMGGILAGAVILVWFVAPVFFESGSEMTVSVTPGIERGKPKIPTSIQGTPGTAGQVGAEVEDAYRPPIGFLGGQDADSGADAGKGRKHTTTAAWIADDEVTAFKGPGLNTDVAAKLRYGQKVFWLERRENWDLISLKDGRQVWVQDKYLLFTCPEDVEQEGPQEAVEVLRDFYRFIKKRNLSGAYSLLAPAWKRMLSYAEFAAGYADTYQVDLIVERVEVISDDKVRIYVRLNVDEEQGSTNYMGYYELEEINGAWLLTGGWLQKVTH